MNDDRWVEKRVESLEAPHGWRPNAARAFAQVRERDRVYHVRRRRWLWVTVAASVASLSVLAIPGRCDAPGSTSCGQPLVGRIWHEVFSRPVEEAPPPTAAPSLAGFKAMGSPTAPIVCEIYTDYECPACAALYRNIIPMLRAEYVQTGKVRILHRDLPLSQHPYSRLAARYANAAGRLGEYDLVVNYLFQTQSQWGADGNVDRVVAQMLSSGIMQKVRDQVEKDETLDNSVTADAAMAMQDQVHRTPTIMVVAKGQRHKLENVGDWGLLQTYLDGLLK